MAYDANVWPTNGCTAEKLLVNPEVDDAKYQEMELLKTWS
jgi:hypothetical protein